MSADTSRPDSIRIGVAGLGRAFTLMLPTFMADERVKLVGASDPIAIARSQFEKDFAAPTFDSIEALCKQDDVEAIYIATPHQFHAEHVRIAASHGKHVLVEKPMAITLAECASMIDAVERAGVQMIVGHSHSFNAPVLQAAKLIAQGTYGDVRMIHAMNFTDFLYRPRRPEELDTKAGGGVIHSQAAHQIDIVRLLGGGMVTSVFAQTGAWDRARPTEVAYSAIISFANGAFASSTYSGYGHFDSDEYMDRIGEMGQTKNSADYGAARRRLSDAKSADEEAALKAARNYGGDKYTQASFDPNRANQHFGPVIVSCDKADLRITALGIHVYADQNVDFIESPVPAIPRAEVIDELVATLRGNKAPLHSGRWAQATTEVTLALLTSAETKMPVVPTLQVAPQIDVS